MIPESEINQRAGRLADTVVNMLTSDGMFKAAVVVAQTSRPEVPLSIRTANNKGFGYEDASFHDTQSALLRQASLQLKYASRTSGRSRLEQLDKMVKTERNASSWGLDLPPDLNPEFAHDKEAGLTVVASLAGGHEEYSARISERAVRVIETDTNMFASAPEASELIYACGETLMKLGLPENRTGFVVLAHPIFKYDPNKDLERGPLVLCSQSFGSAVDELTGFPIVKAKAGTVAITGRPSGSKNTGFYKAISNIKGGLPISTFYGDRALAAGGLSKEDDDVAAVMSAVDYLHEKLGVSLISGF